MSNRFCVVPTNRPESLQRFLKEWEDKGGWDSLVIVEDSPLCSPQIRTDLDHYECKTGVKCYHTSWDQINKSLKDKSWIISRKDSAIRSFGFLLAYWLGADYTLTLDDDCYPHADYSLIFINHVTNLHPPRWSQTAGRRTRGLPYINLGSMTNVVISMGLWSGVPDLDANTQIYEGVSTDFCPPYGHRFLACGEYAPICGMNLCFARRATPLMYFPLMGEGVKYRRFDDIWMGIIAKKLCDKLDWLITIGEPFVHHSKASDVHANLEREAPGLDANEHFWEVIDKALPSGKTFHPLVVMKDMGQALILDSEESSAPVLAVGADYLRKLGTAILGWVDMLTTKPEGL